MAVMAMMMRVVKLALASAWAGALIVVGALLWPLDTVLATCWLAAGQCVAMWLVADDLFPRALSSVVGFLKLTAALVFLAHLATLGWLVLGSG